MARRKSDKFIPDSDRHFALMARNFHRHISRDPARFHFSANDAQLIDTHVTRFREALALVTRPSTRNPITTLRKDEARREAVQIIRRYANIIRANPDILRSIKLELNIKERPKNLSKRSVPQSAPQLIRVRSEGEMSTGEGRHVLRYAEQFGAGTHAKPDGVDRVELYAGLIGPNDDLPAHPSALSGGLFWHLGAWTKSPMRVQYPLPAQPMRVVYFAYWAGGSGSGGKCGTGPWSKPCDGGIVHCSSINAMRIEDQRANQSRPLPVIIQRVDPTPLLPDEVGSLRRLPEAA